MWSVDLMSEREAVQRALLRLDRRKSFRGRARPSRSSTVMQKRSIRIYRRCAATADYLSGSVRPFRASDGAQWLERRHAAAAARSAAAR